MSSVLVLYSDIDEENELLQCHDDPTQLVGPEPNAYTFPHNVNEPVRRHHIDRSFPMKLHDPTAHYVFRVQGPGVFLDLPSPASLVPRAGPQGSVILKVTRSPAALPVPSESDIMRELSAPVPESYWEFKRRMPSSGGIATKAVSRLAEIVEDTNIEDTIKVADEKLREAGTEIKRAARRVSKAVANLDEEKIKKGLGKMGKGLKGLWGKATEAAANLAEQATNATSPPVQIGRFRLRIVQTIAEGGFSVVYLAKDEGNQKTYAVKRMVAQDKETRKDCVTEVKLLKAMRHSNIIQLLDSDVTDDPDGRPGTKIFQLLFDYIPETAYDVISSNISRSPNYEFSNVNTYATPFTEPDALAIIVGCASALAYMHDKLRVSHRDFK